MLTVFQPLVYQGHHHLITQLAPRLAFWACQKGPPSEGLQISPLTSFGRPEPQLSRPVLSSEALGNSVLLPSDARRMFTLLLICELFFVCLSAGHLSQDLVLTWRSQENPSSQDLSSLIGSCDPKPLWVQPYITAAASKSSTHVYWVDK